MFGQTQHLFEGIPVFKNMEGRFGSKYSQVPDQTSTAGQETVSEKHLENWKTWTHIERETKVGLKWFNKR